MVSVTEPHLTWRIPIRRVFVVLGCDTGRRGSIWYGRKGTGKNTTKRWYLLGEESRVVRILVSSRSSIVGTSKRSEKVDVHRCIKRRLVDKV